MNLFSSMPVTVLLHAIAATWTMFRAGRNRYGYRGKRPIQ